MKTKFMLAWMLFGLMAAPFTPPADAKAAEGCCCCDCRACVCSACPCCAVEACCDNCR